MPLWICETFGIQYPDSPEPPGSCVICEDSRQYLGWAGQRRTTLAEGVLWDCVPLLDGMAEAAGELRAIAISHPRPARRRDRPPHGREARAVRSRRSTAPGGTASWPRTGRARCAARPSDIPALLKSGSPSETIRVVQARTIAALAAVVACVLVGGAGGGVAADTFAGTWNLAPAPGTPWSGGGTLTISPASSTAVPGATGQVAWDSYVKGYCTGPPSPGATAAKVRAWYALHYSWSGGGSMGGCVSDKTNGQLIFFGSGSMGHVQGRNGNQIFGDWTNNPNGSSRFSATLASGGGGTTGATASVAEPAPDHAVAITSPDALPLAALGLVSVTGSAGDTKGTTIVAEGSITAKALGNLVAECWLIWEPDPEDGDLSSGAKLRWCIAMVKGTLEAYAHRKPASVSADVPEVASVAPRLGVGGCRVERLTFSARVSKGKATAIKPIKAALTAKSVRYGCSASGGTLKIKVDGRVKGGLPKQLGPKLDLKVVRNDTAPKRSNKLTFGFSW